MTNEEIQQLVAQELKRPQLGVTKQFLAIHQVSYLDGQPLLKSVVQTPDGGQRAYVAVEGERFYLSMYFGPKTEQIEEVDTEPYHDIWLRATSETLEPEELATLTTLTRARQLRKGDKRFGALRWEHHLLDFRLYLQPDLFEHMLTRFLDYLEQDTNGIRALATQAECCIRVASYFHRNYRNLGGHYLDAATLRRISNLHLSIDFDLYAKGNSWLREADE